MSLSQLIYFRETSTIKRRIFCSFFMLPCLFFSFFQTYEQYLCWERNMHSNVSLFITRIFHSQKELWFSAKPKAKSFSSLFSCFVSIITDGKTYQDFVYIKALILFDNVHVSWNYWNIAESCSRGLKQDWESSKPLKLNFEKYIFIRFCLHPFEHIWMQRISPMLISNRPETGTRNTVLYWIMQMLSLFMNWEWKSTSQEISIFCSNYWQNNRNTH
jgi:hypothetical protein